MADYFKEDDDMATLRKLQRSVAKKKMEVAGIEQPNKTLFKYVNDKGEISKVKRPSFFSKHWRDKV